MSGQIFVKACNNKLSISLVMLLLCWSCNNFGCLAQDDFSDDAGADTTGADATSDMMDRDPGIVNPERNQNSGLDIPSTNSKGKGGKNKDKPMEQKSIRQITIDAAMQFGVLVGVALMVGLLFFFMVWADMLYTSLSDKFTAKFAVHKPVDIEDQDPATLVGTFKRYK